MLNLEPGEELFVELPVNRKTLALVGKLKRVRGNIYLDPLVVEPWSCAPDRCRPLFGRNLCCKVQIRCDHFVDELCSIHEEKPFSCALFPIDLFSIGGARVVTTPMNLGFFNTGLSRYDRDMLRCFDNLDPDDPPMCDAIRPVLQTVFTRSEMAMIDAGFDQLKSLRRGT